MDWPKLPNNLKLDAWYMVFVYIGVCGFLLSIFVPVQVFDNKNIMTLMLGLMFIGLGEWKNQKVKSFIKEANFYTGGPALVQTKFRHPDLIGNVLDIIGGILIIIFLIQISGILEPILALL